MKCRLALLLVFLLPVWAFAQSPAIFSTVKTTDVSATSLCVGCTVGGTTPAANSGLKFATVTIEPYAAPTITTNKLYNIAGALSWNGTTLATGSTIAGTTNTIGIFTGVAAMGNSLLTQSGTTVTMAGTLAATTFSGSGALLTAIPTSALTGNYVATITAGTGLTFSAGAGTGTGSTPTIAIANTAVTPGAYSFVTVDQQGRITTASNNNTTGSFTLSGMPDSTPGLTLSGATTNRPTIELRNATTGALVQFIATNTKDLQIATNAGGTYILQGYASGGLYIGGQSPVDPGANIVQIAGALKIGGANVTDAVATPTIASGFGTGPAIAGKAYAFVVTIGTGGPVTGTVNFNATFANAPICHATSDTQFTAFWLGPTTTTLVIQFPVSATAGSKIYVGCRGY